MAAAAKQQVHQWCGTVKQVTKSNFAESLKQFRAHIRDADFVAISSRTTGDLSAAASSSSQKYPWQRVLSIDASETAYLKAKLAAESFEILQLAVCPFRLRSSEAKVTAFPYNFHLFPRDELNLGVPSYSFSCQTSLLTSMAREGFDFNLCIYDGISYLSRAQESIAKCRKPSRHVGAYAASLSPSLADSIFMERIKHRVIYWLHACKNPSKTTDSSLVISLRKLISGETYGSRPCISIDVCSDRQVQLAFQMVQKISDELVLAVVYNKGGQAKTMHVVLTRSEDDKNLLMREIQDLEEEENMKLRGFQEVLDLISNTNKPIVGFNCLHELTFIHSKFLSPLPPSVAEFMCSLRLAFPNILDINYLLKEIGISRKGDGIPATLSHLKRQFLAHMDMEVPPLGEGETKKNYGHNVLRLTYLFAQLNAVLKIVPDQDSSDGQSAGMIENYANVFYPFTNIQEYEDEDVDNCLESSRKMNANNLVFFWGFSAGSSVVELKRCLRKAHFVFAEDFDMQMIDWTCAVAIFLKSGSATTLLKDMESGATEFGGLRELMQEGLKATRFETYRKVCRLGFWESDLADSLDKALAESSEDEVGALIQDAAEIYRCNGSEINLNDL